MKNIFNILLIVFVVISFLIVKDDVFDFFSKVFSQNHTAQVQETKDTIGEEAQNQGFSFKKIISQPGPLIFGGQAGTNTTLTVSGVVKFTNSAREENGNLVALKVNDRLNKSAEMKLDDMFDKGYFEHVSPQGLGPGDMAEKAGYDYLIMGENLATGLFEGDRGLTDAWMESPGHRANILNGKYTEIGVAIQKGKFMGTEKWVAVQHFGLPTGACGKVDELLKVQIEVNKEKLANLESDLNTLEVAIEDAKERKDDREYKKLVNEYNVEVAQYNSLIAETKEEIVLYNKQVSNFNSCLASVKE